MIQQWTDVLWAEESAVYAYGLITARLPPGEDRDRARAGLDAHRAKRDVARAELATQGMSPPAPAVYTPAFPVRSPSDARRLATAVELEAVDQYVALAAAVEGPARRQAAESAQESSNRAASFGWVPTAFPTSTDVLAPTPTAEPTA